MTKASSHNRPLLIRSTILLIGVLVFLYYTQWRSERFTVARATDTEADIYPDYRDVTIPPNIAPLCFHIAGEGKRAAILASGTDTLWLMADDGDVTIPPDGWRRLLQTSPEISVTVCSRAPEGWTAARPFSIHISPDSIDSHLVYRLIPPLYGTWRYMGIYQRDLQSYDESPIYRNEAYHGNCVNCHSFCARTPSRMQLHLRGEGGGTYITGPGGECTRLDTKTDSTISNFTYPYWHPSGRFIAYSVNDIFQIFHTSDPNRIEVIDDDSDIVVYDTGSGEAFSSPLLRRKGVLETFPAFSPDGRRLYFCSAPHPGQLPEQYQDVHYSLCAIDFDPDSRTFGTRVDTLVHAADSLSVSFPRPSPDGRRLALTIGSYGNFSIWHKDADLWMLDLPTLSLSPMTEANSPDVESYHSWSGNSRWLVYSSRRDDGLYTRPYFIHIAEDGTLGRPFMLPQRHPRKFYTDRMESFNIPEFASGPVPVSTSQVLKWIDQTPTKVKYTQIKK